MTNTTSDDYHTRLLRGEVRHESFKDPAHTLRALDLNPRALGTNPRASGTNPRALARNKWALRKWKRHRKSNSGK
jgi:hypothetical protein